MRRVIRWLSIPVIAGALLTSAVTPAAATPPSVTDPTVPDVKIVSPENSDCEKWDPAKTRAENEVVPCPWFPSMVKLANGDLYLAYSWSISHSNYSQIVARRSTDNGLTWSPQQVIVDDTIDDKEPNLTVLRNGDIMMWYYDYVANRVNPRKIYVRRSTDNGQTWSAPVVPPTVSYDSAQGYAAGNGEMIELDNGDLLLPFTSMRHRNGSLGAPGAHVVRGRPDGNGGYTWSRDDERVVMWEGPVFVPNVTVWHVEPALANLGNGHIMMVSRTNNHADVMRVSHSYDNGDTWTQPVDEPSLKGHAPNFLKLPGGTHLFTYGDRSNAWTQGRPVVGRMYLDSLGWTGAESKLIYRNPGVWSDMSYPAGVLLDDGRIFTVYYDRGEGILGGTYITPEPVTLNLANMYQNGQVSLQTDLTHTASSKPMMQPSAPLDGNVSYWYGAAANSAAPPARYWQLDLGQGYPVTDVGIVLKPGYQESAQVEVSATGSGDWSTIRTYTMKRTDDYDWIPLRPERNVRYVKVTITDTTGNGHAMFNDIAIRVAPTTFNR